MRHIRKFLKSNKLKNPFLIIPIFLIVLQFFQIVYFEQSYFLEKYDAVYWKDRFEHSQWQMPLSKRIIGDDGLFSYVGYQLVRGADPSFVDAEVPPLGKYLIGFSIIIFKNPAYYALFFGLGSLLLFYFVAQKLFNDKLISIPVTAVLFLDPLFFSQFFKSWLDITQLFFLLANFLLTLFIFDYKGKKRAMFLLLGGFTLGLFSQVKLPIFLPIIFLLEIGVFIHKKIKKELAFYLLGILIAIFIVYINYFMVGHSLFDFVKLQKYMISFYRLSHLDVHLGAIWKVLFLGQFPDIVTGIPSSVQEWWLVWPVITIIGLLAAFKILLSKNILIIWKMISIFVLLSLFVYSSIPFYPRYLIIILPFLYLLSVRGVGDFLSIGLKKVVFITILLYGLVNSFLFLSPAPDAFLSDFYHNYSNQYFKDIYEEDLSKVSRSSMGREEFNSILLNIFNKADIKSIGIKELERNVPRFGSNGFLKIQVMYKTQNLGPFTENKTLQLIKERNQWKIKWDWNLALNKFHPGDVVDTKIIPGKRGTIFRADNNILAQDADGYLIDIDPSKIDRNKESEMLKILSYYSKQKAVHIQDAYNENILPGSLVPIATSFLELNEADKNKLLSFPGLSLKEYPNRIYDGLNPTSITNTFYDECCSRIYSSYNYHGISGVEKKYDKKLSGYDGGEIILKDEKNNIIRKILEKKGKNGEDVHL